MVRAAADGSAVGRQEALKGLLNPKFGTKVKLTSRMIFLG